MDDLEGDLFGFNLFERLDNSFDRALGIGFDYQLKDFVGGGFELGKQIFKRDFGTSFLAEGFGFLFTLAGKFTRRFFVFDNTELKACFGNAIQAEHFDGYGRRGFFKTFSFFIDQGSDTPIVLTTNDHVTQPQSAFAHQHGCGRASRFKARFNDISFCTPVRIGFELEEIGLEQDHFYQFIDTALGQRRNIHVDRITTPIVRHQSLILKLLPHLHRIGVGMINLIHRYQNGDLRGTSMVKRFDRLWHDAVVCSDHQHDQIRHVGAARTHGTKGRVARRV